VRQIAAGKARRGGPATGRRSWKLRGFARSAALRRDLLRIRAHVIAGGDPMRRRNKSERVRIALTLNGRKLAAEAEARTLLSDFLRHSLGATGHPCRLRARHLRLLHRPHRRRRGALLPDARGAGRGRAVTTVKRSRAGRHAQSAPRSLPHQSCLPMRLLHAGHPDVVHRLSGPQSAPLDGEIREVLSGTCAAAPAMPGIVKAVKQAAGRRAAISFFRRPAIGFGASAAQSALFAPPLRRSVSRKSVDRLLVIATA